MTKLLFEETTGHVIGCGIVGPAAGISWTIHPHPTLSETMAMAAAWIGSIRPQTVDVRGPGGRIMPDGPTGPGGARL
jgi:hypothetical protein